MLHHASARRDFMRAGGTHEEILGPPMYLGTLVCQSGSNSGWSKMYSKALQPIQFAPECAVISPVSIRTRYGQTECVAVPASVDGQPTRRSKPPPHKSANSPRDR